MTVAIVKAEEKAHKSFCNCATCSEFYRGRGVSHTRPGGAFTLRDAMAAADQNIRQLNRWGPRAVELRDINAPASVESRHAAGWLIRFKAEKRHWEEYLRHYRLMLAAHPEWEARGLDDCEVDWSRPARPEPIPSPPDPRLSPETDEVPF